MKPGSSRGMDTRRQHKSEQSKRRRNLRLTNRSTKPYPWPPKQAQPDVSKPGRSTCCSTICQTTTRWDNYQCMLFHPDRWQSAFRALFDRNVVPMKDNQLRDSQRQSILMRDRQISLVLDIGANKGQYGKSLRTNIGYKSRIVSFEPLDDAFGQLQQSAAGDPLWECHNIAFGDSNETATINISADLHSSSLLPVSGRTLEIEPSVAYVGTQEVFVRRLDSVLDQFAQIDDRIFLKIDTQGYELKILSGALGVINRFLLI